MGFLSKLCCLLAFSAQLATCWTPEDTSALVQREAHLVRSNEELGPQMHRFQLSAQLLRTVIRTTVSQLHSQLEHHEAELKREREGALKVRQYVHKLQSTLGRRGTIFGELAGLMPKGQFDESDTAVAMALLGLLRDKKFSSAVVTAFRDMADQVQQYRWKSEKRVTELVVASANASDSKLPLLLKGFFGNQHHMFAAFLKTVETDLRNTINALPANYTLMTGIANSLVDQLMHRAEGFLSDSTEGIVESQGGKFCGSLDVMLSEDFLPIANQSVNAFHGIDSFAKANMPDVEPVAAKITKAVSSITRLLAQTHADAGSWIERVCGLVGAAALS